MYGLSPDVRRRMSERQSSASRAMGPLSTLHVVEMAGIGPAPFAAMLLADLGADVVRIERPEGHLLGNFLEPQHDILNRGKRSVAINLKESEGVSLAQRLVARADVLIEGFRPGVMERLGLGPDACLAENPRLVYARMTGWGQDGPLATTAGHDVNYIAVIGALHAIGHAGAPPAIPLNLLGDFAGGSMFLVTGILAAVIERERSGRGQVIDAAIVDGTAALLAHLCGMRSAGAWSDARGTNLLDGGAPWYATYETRDGEHVAVGAIEPKFYEELMRVLSLDRRDLPGQWEVERWPALREAFSAAFRERTRDEWTGLFASTDACVAPVLTVDEAAMFPHLRERGTFVESAGLRQPAAAPRFSRSTADPPRPPCALGEHTDEVLCDAGVTSDELADLRRRGIVGATRS